MRCFVSAGRFDCARKLASCKEAADAAAVASNLAAAAVEKAQGGAAAAALAAALGQNGASAPTTGSYEACRCVDGDAFKLYVILWCF